MSINDLRGANGEGDKDLAHQINEAHHACVHAARSAVEHAVRAGGLLAEAKKATGFGNWERWLEENFDGGKSTAQLYMKLWRSRELLVDAKTQRVRDLSFREALTLISPPREPDGASSDEGSERAPAGARKEATGKALSSRPAVRPASAASGAAETVLGGRTLKVDSYSRAIPGSPGRRGQAHFTPRLDRRIIMIQPLLALLFFN